jgi:hypothetical protein
MAQGDERGFASEPFSGPTQHPDPDRTTCVNEDARTTNVFCLTLSATDLSSAALRSAHQVMISRNCRRRFHVSCRRSSRAQFLLVQGPGHGARRHGVVGLPRFDRISASPYASRSHERAPLRTPAFAHGCGRRLPRRSVLREGGGHCSIPCELRPGTTHMQIRHRNRYPAAQ